MRGPWRYAGAAAVLCCALVRGPARADAGVCIRVAAPGGELHPELLATFDELLHRKGARRVEPGRSGGCARQIVLALAAVPSAVTVHAEALPSDGRVVERRVARDPSPALFHETLAHAMYGAVSAWLEIADVSSGVGASAPRAPNAVPIGGNAPPRQASQPADGAQLLPANGAVLPASAAPDAAQVAQKPETREPSARVPPAYAPNAATPAVDSGATRAAARAPGLRVGAGAGGVWWSGSGPDARIFGALAYVMPRRLAPEVAARLGLSVPRTADPAALPIRRGSGFFRLGAGVRAAASGRYELRVLGLAGLDLLAVAPAQRAPDTIRRARGVVPVPSLGALLSLHVALWAHTELLVEAGVDVALRRLRYVARGDTDTLFFATPRLLPYAQLVINFNGLFAGRAARSREGS